MQIVFALLSMICCCLDKRVAGTLSFKFETTTLCPNNQKLPATILHVKSFNLKGKLCTIAEVDVKETITGPILVTYILWCRVRSRPQLNSDFMFSLK